MFALLTLSIMGTLLFVLRKLPIMRSFSIREVRLCSFLVFLLIYQVVEGLVLSIESLEVSSVGGEDQSFHGSRFVMLFGTSCERQILEPNNKELETILRLGY